MEGTSLNELREFLEKFSEHQTQVAAAIKGMYNVLDSFRRIYQAYKMADTVDAGMMATFADYIDKTERYISNGEYAKAYDELDYMMGFIHFDINQKQPYEE